MSELVVSKKQKVEEIDWENMDASQLQCSIEYGVNCESCAG
jgi:hypothetical protein